ncbi:MAG TPA: hypothetical protein VKT28_15440 [Puia sp.]|nr:hypothetical protein [Puia sp.]
MIYLFRSIAGFLWLPSIVIVLFYLFKAIALTKKIQNTSGIDIDKNFMGIATDDGLREAHRDSKLNPVREKIFALLEVKSWLYTYLWVTALVAVIAILLYFQII